MDQISLDFIGSISRTVNDITRILVAVEHFLCWARHILLPYPVHKASTMAFNQDLASAESYTQTREVLSYHL